MLRHCPTPAINWPPFIAGPSGPTAMLPGRVHGPGPGPAAKLALDVMSGNITVNIATAPSNFNRFIVVSVLMDLLQGYRCYSVAPSRDCESQQAVSLPIH